MDDQWTHAYGVWELVGKIEVKERNLVRACDADDGDLTSHLGMFNHSLSIQDMADKRLEDKEQDSNW